MDMKILEKKMMALLCQSTDAKVKLAVCNAYLSGMYTICWEILITHGY